MSENKVDKTTKLMTRPQAAHYVTTHFGVPLSPLTLEKWATQNNTGPKYAKLGRRVFYAPADLDSWFQSSLSRKFSSSSDEARGDFK